MLHTFGFVFPQELVRLGIPHHFRGIVWQLLCDAYNSPLKEKYIEYLKMQSPYEKVIRRDIARTYPEHDFFKEKDGLGQETLFNVMKVGILVIVECDPCIIKLNSYSNARHFFFSLSHAHFCF